MPQPKITSDWLSRRQTQAVLRVLNTEGHTARIVGGAVRNALLGEPVTDIDIATTAAPETVMRITEVARYQVVATGLKHGTVTVIVEGSPFEVTTLRKDVATDGRHAEVAYTEDWEADASRRDFTINALYCDADGTLFDPLGGLADIRARQVRFIGNPHDRIREDYLRILRFFRFFAQYSSGTPEASALLACVQERAGLRRLSGERVRQEFLKLANAPRAVDAIQAMQAHGLLTELLPVAPNPELFERIIACDSTGDAPLRLAALTIHVFEDAERIGTALKLSNADRRIFTDFAVTWLNRAPLPQAPKLRAQQYMRGEANYRRHIMALWACTQAAKDDAAYAAALAQPQQWSPPTFPLSGSDVIALGIPSGPRIGEILAQLEAEWISGDFGADRAALLAKLGDVIQQRTSADTNGR